MVAWESIWRGGELVAAQVGRRLYWEFSNLTPSGVTGVGGAWRWISDPVVAGVARQAVMAVDSSPNGIFSVDMNYDSDGEPKVTEINAGRFLSGGVIHMTNDCFNFARAAVLSTLDKIPSGQSPVLNPLSETEVFIHGMNKEPLGVDREEIDKYKRQLNEHRASRVSR